MIRTQIQLTQEQSRRIKEVAEREEISMAEVIRRAVDFWLETGGTLTKEERRQRAVQAVREIDGKYYSDSSDVSANHDTYLDEVYGAWKSS
jgi:Arc/MetJ-type ribon-helix-helix transcriptional regulator